MPSNKTTFWDNEVIQNVPPAVKTMRLHCPGVVSKVELSFMFDVTNFKGCILDPLKPLSINDRLVTLQLPADKEKLKLVEMSGIDVTDYVKATDAGEVTKIAVNYRVRDQPYFFSKFGKKNVGRLRLALTVHWLEAERKCPNGHEIPPGDKECLICHPREKFCMWHGEPVQATATFCPFQGGPRYETVITPTTQKICPICKRKIHIREIHCEYCGNKQALTSSP
jgi:hypothetical protein